MKKAAKILLGLGLVLGFSQMSIAHHDTPRGAESDVRIDRIQVNKGWYKDGELHEKIYNVALSDNRKVNADGTVDDNGATVNMETGEWDKSKGAIELQTVWTDEDFDPNVRCFYYLRVLELPNFVLSCGGGTPCYYNNMEEINTHAHSFYLQETPKTLADRLQFEKQSRPLVKNIEDKDMFEFVAKHLFERRPFYETAQNTVRGEDKIEQILNIIKED